MKQSDTITRKSPQWEQHERAKLFTLSSSPTNVYKTSEITSQQQRHTTACRLPATHTMRVREVTHRAAERTPLTSSRFSTPPRRQRNLQIQFLHQTRASPLSPCPEKSFSGKSARDLQAGNYALWSLLQQEAYPFTRAEAGKLKPYIDIQMRT